MPDQGIRELTAEVERLQAEVERLRVTAAGARPGALPGDLAAIVEGLPLMVFLLDAEDRFRDFRAGRPAELYAPPGDFVGKRIDDVLPPPLGARLREELSATRRDRKERTIEYHLDAPTGPHEYEARVVPVSSDRVAVIVLETTERRRAEEELRRSEERFRVAFEGAPIGMAMVGLDERILDANEALCAMLGHPRERLVGMTVPEITHPEDRAVEETQKELLRGGSRATYGMEKRYVHADGHVVWGLLSVSAVRDARGEPRYFLGQLVDLSERRRAEEELRRSEERFRALIERSTDLLVVVDAEARYRFWSPGATDALGFTEAEVLGRSALELVHPEDVPAAARALGEIGSTPGAHVRLSVRQRHRDGSWRIIDVVGRNLFHVPSVAGIVVNARDVTEQRRLAEQLQHVQKLEGIGRLAGGVAHDFNNVLTVILSCAEALERDLATTGRGNPEDVRDIRGAAERAREVTRQLLAFARRQVIAPVPLDLNALLRDTRTFLARLLGEDVDVEVRTAPDLWTVRCDPSQLQQVLLNLAVNARDAMPRGGKVTVETENALLDAQYAAAHAGVVPGPYVLLSFSDSGEGLTDEAKAHVFEPFFTTKGPGRGTGLGLATVYGIVQQSGGHVWVYSERGAGTTFKVYLPRDEAAPAPLPAAPPPRTRTLGGTETVLVVEDDAKVRQVTAGALREAGYRVLEAADGREALAVAERAPRAIDLLVTDVVMPGPSGREVAQALLARLPGLRVLYVSGYTQNTIVHHGVLDSGVQFLSKPFTPAALLLRVREVLDGS